MALVFLFFLGALGSFALGFPFSWFFLLLGLSFWCLPFVSSIQFKVLVVVSFFPVSFALPWGFGTYSHVSFGGLSICIAFVTLFLCPLNVGGVFKNFVQTQVLGRICTFSINNIVTVLSTTEKGGPFCHNLEHYFVLLFHKSNHTRWQNMRLLVVKNIVPVFCAPRGDGILINLVKTKVVLRKVCNIRKYKGTGGKMCGYPWIKCLVYYYFLFLNNHVSVFVPPKGVALYLILLESK